jgi:hypothetical protein
MFLVKISIIIVSLIGLGTVFYAFLKRGRKGNHLPDKAEDARTIDYIRSLIFLDTPLEIFIMVYFTITALAYGGMLIASSIVPGLYLAILYLSGTIFLLLGYKALMEKGILGEWSPWVLFSSILSIVIFILVLYGLDVPLIPLLKDAEQYNLTIHLLGVVMGLGATTVVDIMFIHFIQNLKIARRESVIMHLLSQMIILGLILIILSGIAIFLTDIEGFLDSPRFLMKMMAVFVAAINGLALNLYVTPKMEKISLIEEEKGRHERLKTVSFALGGISIVSWYSAFFLAMIKDLGAFSFVTLLIAYLILLAMAIGGSQFAKRYYEKKGLKQD